MAGVSPLGALQAATRNPAIFMGVYDRYGSVAVAKVADFVLLDADPLQDIRSTTRIAELFLGGRQFDRAAPDKIPTLAAVNAGTASAPADSIHRPAATPRAGKHLTCAANSATFSDGRD